MDAAFVPVENFKALAIQHQELKQRLELQATQFKYWIDHPWLIALVKGDLYLRAEDADAFRAPLARLLFCPVEDVEPRPAASAPDAAGAEIGSSAPVPGLRETVAAVVTILAEAGLIGVMARPGAAPEVGFASAPSPPSLPAAPGTWAPPTRPGPLGANSAARRAIFDLLSRP